MDMNKHIELFSSGLSLQRDPDLDFGHHFKGYGIHDSWVNIKMWAHGQQAIILITNGEGTSVTNAAEQILTEVYNKSIKYQNFHHLNCVWIETYNPQKGIDFIIPKWAYKGLEPMVESVTWKHLGKLL